MFLRNRGPRMIGGYKRLIDGVFLPKTRIGDTTFIDNPNGFDISDDVYIGHFNFIECSNIVIIKTGAQITNYVSITSHSSHDSIRLYGANYKGNSNLIGYQKGSIEIGAYSYIGPYSTLMPNTKIGKGSIIAAYSYVQGEFPDFSIIQGNPAKIIGSTKDRDHELLNKHPELRTYYDIWAKNEENEK